MEGEAPIPAIEGISADDWQGTPAQVQRLIVEVVQRLGEVEAQLAFLRQENGLLRERLVAMREENRLLHEQLAGNSQNSSRPPSSDGPGARPARASTAPSNKKRGAQPGHKGKGRKLVPVEQCQQVEDHYPEQCYHCGELLSGNDSAPYRHQVMELPEVAPHVEEHRLHRLRCEACGRETRARLPAEVPACGYGPRVAATVALLGGMYRVSERLTQAAMADLFGVAMSLGTVNALRQEAREAVAAAVDEAHAYVQKQAVVYADETGFHQGDTDGSNPEGRKAWLWVAVTSLVSVFQVGLSRGQEAARSLLGASFAGFVVSDRWSGYPVKLDERQLVATLASAAVLGASQAGVSEDG